MAIVVIDPPSRCDLDFGGPSIASLMFSAAYDPLGHDLHVDCDLPFLPF